MNFRCEYQWSFLKIKVCCFNFHVLIVCTDAFVSHLVQWFWTLEKWDIHYYLHHYLPGLWVAFARLQGESVNQLAQASKVGHGSTSVLCLPYCSTCAHSNMCSRSAFNRNQRPRCCPRSFPGCESSPSPMHPMWSPPPPWGAPHTSWVAELLLNR